MPTICFSDPSSGGTGSDTTASGSAGAVVANGTAASYSGSVFTLDGSPDLSAWDNAEDILWVDTSSGRQFFDATSVDDTAKTITVVNAPAGTASGLTWGIGGKRATFNNSNSRTVFSTVGAKEDWIIETETDQSISSQLTISCPGAIRGSAGGIKTITQTANVGCCSFNSANYITISNLKFQNSNTSSKTSSHGLILTTNTPKVTVINCVLGDSTNTLLTGVVRSVGTPPLIVQNCVFESCSSHALSLDGATGGVEVIGCVFKNNANDFTCNGPTTISDCLSYGCSGVAFELSSASPCTIIGNTIHGAGSDGILLPGSTVNMVIINNIITGCAGYGINMTGGGTNNRLWVDYNCFGSASSSPSSTLNSSGPASSNVVLQANNLLSVDPQYTNVGSGDFSVGTNMKAAASPPSSATMGLGVSNTTTYKDLGGVQRQEFSSLPIFNIGI